MSGETAREASNSACSSSLLHQKGDDHETLYVPRLLPWLVLRLRPATAANMTTSDYAYVDRAKISYQHPPGRPPGGFGRSGGVGLTH